MLDEEILTEEQLDRLRLEYHHSSSADRQKMVQEILQQETWCEKLENDIQQLKKLSQQVPVFYDTNFSVGIHIIRKLLKCLPPK